MVDDMREASSFERSTRGCFLVMVLLPTDTVL